MWQGLFKRVLWVPLRHLKLEGRAVPSNLEELFRHEYLLQSMNGDAFARELWTATSPEATDSRDTLYILDGLDEYLNSWIKPMRHLVVLRSS